MRNKFFIFLGLDVLIFVLLSYVFIDNILHKADPVTFWIGILGIVLMLGGIISSLVFSMKYKMFNIYSKD
jgi:hypothetical protein